MFSAPAVWNRFLDGTHRLIAPSSEKRLTPFKKFTPLNYISVGSRQIIGLLELPSYEVMAGTHHRQYSSISTFSNFTSLRQVSHGSPAAFREPVCAP